MELPAFLVSIFSAEVSKMEMSDQLGKGEKPQLRSQRLMFESEHSSFFLFYLSWKQAMKSVSADPTADTHLNPC